MSSSEGYPPPPQPQYNPQQYAPPQYSPGRTRRVIKRIDVLSAAKVSAVGTALIFAVFGLFFVLLAICGLLSTLTNSNNGGFGGVGAIGLLFGYIVLVVVYAILGFIVGALYAWIYNMASGWIGGLEVEVE